MCVGNGVFCSVHGHNTNLLPSDIDRSGTVNPHYSDIRYNSKIRYNFNLVCIKISGSCIFSLIFPFYSSGNIRFVYLLESPRRGDSNKYTERMIYKNKSSNVSVTDALDGFISSCFKIANSILQQNLWQQTVSL